MSERSVEIPWAVAHAVAPILDVGCAESTYLGDLPLPIDGIDVRPCHSEFLRHSYQADIRSWSGGQYATVLAISTIEHIGLKNEDYGTEEDDADGDIEAVSACYRHVKPGGKLLVSVPFGLPRDYGWFRQYDLERINKLCALLPFTAEVWLYRNGDWVQVEPAAAEHVAYNEERCSANAVALITIEKPLLKLNLGGGEDRYDGYLTVDLRPEVADVVADVRSLPMDDESVDDIVAFDILEHLPPLDTVPTLHEWKRVLAPGGTLRIKTPNLAELCRWVVDGKYVSLAIQNIYGGHKWGENGELDCHHTGWTPDKLQMLLEECGFEFLSDDLELNHTVEVRKPVVAPQDYKTVGVMKKSPTAIKETQLDKDRAAYQRLRQQGLQPPHIDGCAKLEAEAVTRDEIVMGTLKPDLTPEERKRMAATRREAFERAKDFTS